MSEKIMLTVGMLTYNQKKYVRRALDGIIEQKTTFKFNVVIGDDCSMDGTQDVLIEYKNKYPEMFHLILREQNIGVMKNNFDIKRYANGKYFASIEGDDYWTDPYKLQKQVDFLENNKEYIACSHKCIFVDSDNNPIKNIAINGYYFNDRVYEIKDFERGFLPGQTATMVYRNIYLDTERDYSVLYKASPKIGDKTVILLLLSYGKIYNMDEVMSCYRYIIQENGNNVSSLYIGNNNRDELFEYLCYLEKYSDEVLKMPLNMDYKKKQYFIAAITVYMKNKTNRNRQVVKNILRASKHPISYRFLKLRVILIKLFGWYVVRKDIRIKV